MRLAKYYAHTGAETIGVVVHDRLVPLDLSQGHYVSLSDILEDSDPRSIVDFLVMDASHSVAIEETTLLPPIDNQEVWAAGVTYKRSQTARMEESEAAASCYDRVYNSERPELFFKASPSRVAGPGQSVRIRQDSKWNVPEPEITLVLNKRNRLVGYTIGNDMSSRDIEGDNPLYLPQAKVYDQCCGLGPWITISDVMPHQNDIGVKMEIRRGEEVVFKGESGGDKMARSFEELIEWLCRDNSFPSGAFLLTGTGIVPDSDFTLQPGDVVDIMIDGVGTLSNPVVQG